MDRRVKERLVGASILVVLIVLFVPELLSGPKRVVMPPAPPGSTLPMRSVTIDLATRKATAASDPIADGTDAATSAAPASSASADGQAAGAGVTSGPDAGSGGSTVPPAPDPLDNGAASAKSAGAATKAEPTRRGWVAQVGSFAARDHAEKLERQLRSQGFSPVLSATGAGASVRFRVRIGPVADRGAADKLVVKLGLAGHPATLVAP